MSVWILIACVGVGGGVLGSVVFDGVLRVGRFRESKKNKELLEIEVTYTVVDPAGEV